MAECSYCHQKAGLFKSEHEACAQDADKARQGLSKMISEAIVSGKKVSDIATGVVALKQSGRLSESDARLVMLRAADKATLDLAQSNPVNPEECERISEFFVFADKDWHANPRALVNWSGYISLLHSGTIYEVLHGQVPYQNPESFSDFRFQKGESPILRRNATLAEYRTVSTGYGHQSIGLPIGGGMYYRVGVSQPRSEQTGLMPVDQGLMVITTQAIIFSGQKHNFRLDYSSILRLESFVDGFGVHENHGGGKVFIPALLGTMDEGWYFSNLVSALSKW